MDTGYGKTLTAVCYLRKFLERTGSEIRAALWVTPGDLVQPTLKQLTEQWGIPARVLPASGEPTEGLVNVVKHDALRKVIEPLAAAAARMVIILDEVDTMYAATQRTSSAHRIAALSPKIVCQTATPLRSTKCEHLAEWLKRVESFPVEKKNWLVAANSIVSKQIALGIQVSYHVHEAPLTDQIRKVHLSRQARADSWLQIANQTQAATDAALVQQAIEKAADGVLLTASDAGHAERLLERLRGKGIPAGAFEERGDPSVQVVVVTKRQCRGYNECTRLGSIVTGVYPGNAADRHQLLGRLKRIGQRSAASEHHAAALPLCLVLSVHPMAGGQRSASRRSICGIRSFTCCTCDTSTPTR